MDAGVWPFVLCVCFGLSLSHVGSLNYLPISQRIDTIKSRKQRQWGRGVLLGETGICIPTENYLTKPMKAQLHWWVMGKWSMEIKYHPSPPI